MNSNQSLLESSPKSNQFLDKLMSAFSNQDPNESFFELQSVLEELSQKKQSKQQMLIEEYNQLITPHKCSKIAEIQNQLDALINEINEIKLCEPQTYQISINKLKSVKKILTQIVDKFFTNIKQQYNFVVNDMVQQNLVPIKKLISTLRNDLKNYDENTYQEVLIRWNSIKDEYIQFKSQLPKDITLQISSQAFFDIKEALNKMISINFKDEFKLFPTTFNGHKIIKKGQISLKSKNAQIKQSEYSDSVYAFINNKFYYSNINDINTICEKEVIIKNESNMNLTQCNLINSANNLYLLGCYYQNDQQKQSSNHFIQVNKQTFQILQLAQLPIITFAGLSIKTQEHIYYWGGYVFTDDNHYNNRRGFKYSMDLGQWEQIESMKFPRINGQCCIIDQKIYLIGGMMNSYQSNTLIEIYDRILQKFIQPIELINEMSYIPQMLGYVVPISNQEILIIGGYNEFGNAADIQLINIFLKTIQKNHVQIKQLQNISCSQALIGNQRIHLFSIDNSKLEYIELTADTLQVKNLIPIQ